MWKGVDGSEIATLLTAHRRSADLEVDARSMFDP
jgi:hypothetical protein